MAHSMLSHRRAHVLAVSVFLTGLAVVSFMNAWWPGMLLVVGLPLALHQLLLGKRYDALISLIIFSGGFALWWLNLPTHILLPILFLTSALYLLFREWIDDTTLSEEEAEEELNHQLEEKEE